MRPAWVSGYGIEEAINEVEKVRIGFRKFFTRPLHFVSSQRLWLRQLCTSSGRRDHSNERISAEHDISKAIATLLAATLRSRHDRQPGSF